MPEDFGEFITARRRELELTLGDVATELGVSPISVSNWSNGQSTPQAEQLQALAKLLDVPADDLRSMAGASSDFDLELDVETTSDQESSVTAAETAIPEPDPPNVEAVDAEIDDELAEMIEEASAELEIKEAEMIEEAPADLEIKEAEMIGEAPADLEIKEEVEMIEEPSADLQIEEAVGPEVVAPSSPTPQAAPTPSRPPARRPAAATITAERPVPLPLTYIEDPKQLLRYRIRWGLTVVALVIMSFIFIWAAGELISALSDVKESVTPGGGSS